MGEVSDKIILSALYNYYKLYPGKLKMCFGELREAIGISLDDWKTRGLATYQLYCLRDDKKLIGFTSIDDFTAGLVWLTPDGIRVAQDIQQSMDLTPGLKTARQAVLPKTLKDLVELDEICARHVRRDELLDEIKSLFSQPAACHFIVLYGEPMVGKTTLLERLSETLNDENVPLVINVQGLKKYLGDVDDFVFALAMRLTTKFQKQARRWGISCDLSYPDRKDFEGCGPIAFHRHWEYLGQNTGRKHPVVMIDEIEALIDDPDKLERGILDFLSSFVLDPENGCFVLAGSERILHWSDRDQEFSRFIAQARKTFNVRCYDRDVVHLVFSMFQRHLAIDPDLVQYLATLCDGHPRFLSVIYDVLRDEAIKSPGGQKLGLDHCDRLSKELIRRAVYYLAALRQRLRPEEKTVMQLLAQDISDLGGGLEYSKNDLIDLATGLPTISGIDDNSLETGLKFLEEREWIEWRTTEQFCFKLGVVLLWALHSPRNPFVSEVRL